MLPVADQQLAARPVPAPATVGQGLPIAAGEAGGAARSGSGGWWGCQLDWGGAWGRGGLGVGGAGGADQLRCINKRDPLSVRHSSDDSCYRSLVTRTLLWSPLVVLWCFGGPSQVNPRTSVLQSFRFFMFGMRPT